MARQAASLSDAVVIEATLDGLPDADRQAIVEHLQALVRMTSTKRAALLVLSDGDCQ
jgi:hypothetical protein